MYQIYVRDQYLNRVAEVEDYQNLDVILRFNTTGSWALTLPFDCLAAKELVKRKAGIIVKRNGETIFSGPVTRRNRKWDGEGDKLTISGTDDLKWLECSLGFPSDPPYTTKAYDVRTGVAETIIREYVEENIGASARAERQLPGLILAADEGRGNKVTGRARFHTLLELNQKLALAGGDLGFRLVQGISNHLQFQVYEPTDKTSTVIFSPLLGNLLSFEYETEDAEANYVIVGGGGEGSERIFVEKGDSSSITKYGRIESFVDQRNTEDIDELWQSADEELLEKAEKTSLRISPIDTEALAFGRDYNLGDKVSVVLTQPNEIVEIEQLYYFLSAYQTTPIVMNERVRKIQEKLEVIQDVIREVNISITPDGEVISPSIGTPESGGKQVLGIFDKMRKIRKRISNLERR